jgi:Leucine-rich repeat (LRR) protein
LFSNGANGTLPEDALRKLLRGIVYLDLRNNELHGTLPAILGRAKHLQWILADGNYFSGTLPISWSSLTNLTQLTLGQNQLTGTLPASYTQLSRLSAISLDGNCISGAFPVEFLMLDAMEVCIDYASTVTSSVNR